MGTAPAFFSKVYNLTTFGYSKRVVRVGHAVRSLHQPHASDHSFDHFGCLQSKAAERFSEHAGGIRPIDLRRTAKPGGPGIDHATKTNDPRALDKVARPLSAPRPSP